MSMLLMSSPKMLKPPALCHMDLFGISFEICSHITGFIISSIFINLSYVYTSISSNKSVIAKWPRSDALASSWRQFTKMSLVG